MYTFGISGSGFSQLDSLLASTSQFNSNFKQLGSDLKNGNLAAAQQDFVTLSQDVLSSPLAQASASSATSSAASSGSSTTALASTASTSTEDASGTSCGTTSATAATGGGTQSALSALAQDFQTLGQELQSGNLAGAQQAFSQIQQAAQQGAQSIGGHHRHHHHGSASGGSGNAASELQSLLTSISSAASSLSASATNSATSSAANTSAGNSSATSATTASPSATTATATGSSSTGVLSTIGTDFQSLGKALQSGDLAGAQQAFLQLTQDMQSLSGTRHAHPAENSGRSSSTELIRALLSSQQTASAADGSNLTGSNATVAPRLNVSA